MLNGAGPLTIAIAVVAAAGASLLIYRDADRHGHYHAVSASAAVGVAAVVGFVVANLVGLVVATGYVLLLYLLSYPSTPRVDGTEKRRQPDRPDGTPQGDAGENIAGADDVVSVIRVEIANEGTLRELAARYDDVPADAPEPKLRSMLRVKALENVVDDTETGETPAVAAWADEADASVDDWHDESPSEARPAEGAAAWNAAPSGDDSSEGAVAGANESAAADARSQSEMESDGAAAWSVEATGDDDEASAAAIDGDDAADAVAIDDDAEEVSAGNIEEWTAVGDGGEEESTESAFGWAEVEAEE